jgi:hypothetical protein
MWSFLTISEVLLPVIYTIKRPIHEIKTQKKKKSPFLICIVIPRDSHPFFLMKKVMPGRDFRHLLIPLKRIKLGS